MRNKLSLKTVSLRVLQKVVLQLTTSVQEIRERRTDRMKTLRTT